MTTQNKYCTITIDKAACFGCQVCELVCSLVHENEFNPSLSRIHISRDPFKGTDVPIVCIQCPNPKCLYACSENAIVVDKATQAKIVLEERCTGCGKCAEACPINRENTVIKFHPQRRTYIKCDLCRGDPECVEWCPSEALQYLRIGG